MTLATIEIPGSEFPLPASGLGSPMLLVDRRRGAAHFALPAALANPTALAMMVRFGSGFVYAALPDAIADRLGLPVMVSGGRRLLGGLPTVAVDAAEGVSTGISAADRAFTLRTLADPATVPDDLSRPGHIVPIRAPRVRRFGRRTPVQAALEHARERGLPPVVAMCEMVSERDPRLMADCAEATELAQRLGLSIAVI